MTRWPWILGQCCEILHACHSWKDRSKSGKILLKPVNCCEMWDVASDWPVCKTVWGKKEGILLEFWPIYRLTTWQGTSRACTSSLHCESYRCIEWMFSRWFVTLLTGALVLSAHCIRLVGNQIIAHLPGLSAYYIGGQEFTEGGADHNLTCMCSSGVTDKGAFSR